MPPIFDFFYNLTQKDPLMEMIDIIFSDEEHQVNIREIRECIKRLKTQGRSINEKNKSSGWTSIISAFNQSKYAIAVLLLEEGADPHISSDNICPGFTIIHKCITYGAISQIRLLIWYNQNYHDICNYKHNKKTAAERIQDWDDSLVSKGKAGVKNILEKTVQDSSFVKKLCKEADRLEKEYDFEGAALKYIAIGNIFNEQYNIEKNLQVMHYSFFYELSNPNYKSEKNSNEKCQLAVMRLYMYKAYQYYCFAENMYKQVFNLDNVGKKLRLENLGKLLICSETLNLNSDIRIQYAKQVAILQEDLHPISIEKLAQYSFPLLELKKQHEKAEENLIEDMEKTPLLSDQIIQRKSDSSIP